MTPGFPGVVCLPVIPRPPTPAWHNRAHRPRSSHGAPQARPPCPPTTKGLLLPSTPSWHGPSVNRGCAFRINHRYENTRPLSIVLNLVHTLCEHYPVPAALACPALRLTPTHQHRKRVICSLCLHGVPWELPGGGSGLRRCRGGQAPEAGDSEPPPAQRGATLC